MSLFVLDTDCLSLLQRGHPRVSQRCAAQQPGEVVITVISLEEQLSGWYRLLRQVKQPDDLARTYQNLIDTVLSLARLPILPFKPAAITLYRQLLGMKLNVGRMDLRIAAIVRESGGILVTRNTRDFARVPGLIIEDWSVS
jgi:tRNA(fMet)-specific endonuclease VapC